MKIDGETVEQREERLKRQRLIARRHDLVSIRDYTNKARGGIDMHTPMFDLLVAVEQLWHIEKIRLNKELAEIGITTIKR